LSEDIINPSQYRSQRLRCEQYVLPESDMLSNDSRGAVSSYCLYYILDLARPLLRSRAIANDFSLKSFDTVFDPPHRNCLMEEDDLYISVKKHAISPYVRKDAGLAISRTIHRIIMKPPSPAVHRHFFGFEAA
jgi:hypothetical protein